jgi:hypothetical protein
VLDDCLDEVGGHLHLADAGLGLGVWDAEAGAVGVVQAQVAAELTRPHPGSDTRTLYSELLSDRVQAPWHTLTSACTDEELAPGVAGCSKTLMCIVARR